MLYNSDTKAIMDIERSMWINASAGSGKTTLLIKRLIALLINKRKNIICITFTRAAAAEMQNRLNNILSQLPLMADSEIINFCQEHSNSEESCKSSKNAVININNINNINDINYVKDLLYNLDELVKISTIHSFCLSSLQEIDPALNPILLEESGNSNLFTEIIDEFLNAEHIFANELSEILTENSLKEIFQQFLLKYNIDNGKLNNRRSDNQENEIIIEQLTKFNIRSGPDFNQDIGHRTISLLSHFNKLAAEYKRLRPHKITYNALIDSIIGLINTDSGLLYQLSQKIDHILLDEAQDTNLKQWFLIAKLLEEFFIHEKPAEAHAKTIFIVGDSKQSIYSFQGANPLIFEGFYSLIKSQDIRNNQLLKIEINNSYRSSTPILELVDSIFNCNGLQISESGRLKHNIFRQKDFGYTEIWPFIKSAKAAQEPQLTAAKQIVEKIKEWLTNKRLLPAKGRLVKASDCAILIAHRSSFVSHLQIEFQRHNIPVNFVGKIKIEDNEIFSLLVSIGKFIVAPYDELNLIKLLKTPIFNITDREIFNIKIKDLKTNLWEHIKNSNLDENKKLSDSGIFYAVEILSQWLRAFGSPFNIYCKIITKDIFKRLELYYGNQFAFYLDIFLDNAFKEVSMNSFIERISAEDAQTEINTSNNEGVTISTVHGAKGQQFPIVFLSDSNYIPQQKDILLYNEDNLPFWYKNENIEYFEKIKAFRKKEIYEEYLRLLYVGLTRAEEELYILAWGSNIRKNSWYELGLNAFREIGKPSAAEGGFFYTNFSSTKALAEVSEESYFQYGQYVKNSNNSDNNKPEEREERPLELLNKEVMLSNVIHYDIKNYQGILVHNILQYIFAVEDSNRLEWLENFLANFGLELTLKESENIKHKILEFLSSQEVEDLGLVAQLGSQKIRAELELLYCPSLSSDLNSNINANIISGNIEIANIYEQKSYKRPQLKSQLLRLDSLIINETENSILIIDYKTNQERHINNEIEEQLEKYKQAIEVIYPNKIVKIKIFWL